jgi:hypothetical protein
MKLRILLEAEEEARASAIWYQKQFVGLGDAFLDDLESALRRIEDDPSRFPKLETAKSDHIKRCRFLRFPFLHRFRNHRFGNSGTRGGTFQTSTELLAPSQVNR